MADLDGKTSKCNEAGARLRRRVRRTAAQQAEKIRGADEDRKVLACTWAFPVILFAVIAALALIIETIYFVPLWDPATKLQDLKIKILCADEGMQLSPTMRYNLGQTLAPEIVNNHTSDLFDWIIVNSTETNETYESLREEVHQDDIWAAIYFPANFTRDFVLAYKGLLDAENYNNNVVYICDEAKQYTTGMVVDRVMTSVFRQMSISTVEKMMTPTFQYAFGPNPPATNPAMREPVVLRKDTIHPVSKLGEYFGQYIIFVPLWVGMLVCIGLSHVGFRVDMSEHTKWSFWKVVLARLGTAVGTSFICSLLVGWALKGMGYPTEHGFGMVFGVLWFVSLAFGGMIALLFGLFGNIGILFGVILLVVQLVTCNGIYIWNALASSARWLAWVFPWSHGVALMRYAGFDAYPAERGLHIGIPFAWMLVCWALAVVSWYFRVGERLNKLIVPKGHKGWKAFSKFLI